MFGERKIPKCSHYHKSRHHEFIQECPKDSEGCLTQFEDGSMLRTCASIGVDDCETANGVTYCYCKNELCNNPSKKLSNPNPGSGLSSSPQKSTELLIDTNRQIYEDEDPMENEENHHFHEGSGGWPDDYNYNYSDDSDVFDSSDYGPESEDRTDPPPLSIWEEPKPTPPQRGNKDDFGFFEGNNLDLDHSSISSSNRNFNNKNAKPSHHSNSATSQQQPVITAGSAPTGSQRNFVKIFTWLLLLGSATFFY